MFSLVLNREVSVKNSSLKKERSRFILSLRIFTFLALATFLSPVSYGHGDGSVVKIGILVKREKKACRMQWAPFAAYLTEQIPQKRFRIVPLNFDEVLGAAEKKKVDFMLMNPYYYVVLSHQSPVKVLATLRELTPDGGVTNVFAGVVFCLAKRRDIPPFSQLKGIVFSTPSPMAFGAWLAVLKEFKECGVVPKRDFKQIRFTGSHDTVVFEVAKGVADVGGARTGTLRRMAKEGKIRLEDFRIIHQTERFPEWPFIKLSHVSDSLGQKVAITLLTMSSEDPRAKAARCAGWDIPSNYRSVVDCMKALKLGPYKAIGRLVPHRVFHRYRTEIFTAFFLFLLTMVGFVIMLHYNRIVKRQKEWLEREVETREQVLIHLEESEKRFRDLVLTAGDWVWEVDASGHYTFCSETVTSIMEYTPEEMLGRSPFDFMPEEEAKRVREIFRARMEKKLPIRDLENWNLSKSGKKLCLLTNGVPIFDRQGRFQGYRGVDKDITETKTARQRLTKIYRCLSGLGSDCQENIKSIVETAGEVLKACCVFYHELVGDGLKTVYAWHPPGDFGRDPEKGSVCYQTLNQAKGGVLIVPRLQESRYGLQDSRIVELGLDHYVGCPVFVGREPQGILCAFFKGEKKPVQQAINLLGVLGEALSKELERCHYSQQLKEREEFLATMIESAIDAIVVMDFDRRIIEVNHAFCRMFKFKREEVLGRSISCIHISSEKAEEFKNQAYPVIEKRGFWQGEWKLKRKDGEIIPVETVTAILKSDEGEGKRGYVAFMRDITERKRAEEALLEAHTQLKQIISAIHSILIGLTTEGIVTLWNSISEEVLGLTEEDVIGAPLASCDVAWEWEKIEKGIRDCKTKMESISVGDVLFAGPTRERGILGVTIDPVFNVDGDLMGMLIFAADITDKRVMETQLLQAQKMESIGQLAAGIAHEINTPTQFIGDNLNFLRDAFHDLGQLMKKHTRLVERVKEERALPELVRELESFSEEIDTDYLLEEIPKTVNQSLEGVRRVAKIVQAMKEFSHPGVKKRVLTDLNKAIETALTVTKNAWKYVAEVETELSPNLPPVLCMPGEINQVLLNLIVNAAQAIESKVGEKAVEKGKIVISTRDVKDWVEIRVQDTGIGIPKEIHSRIFDPFFTTKEVGKGTGQGLSIAHDTIVNKHGGQIFFETEPGVGTTFIIRLPIKTDGREI